MTGVSNKIKDFFLENHLVTQKKAVEHTEEEFKAISSLWVQNAITVLFLPYSWRVFMKTIQNIHILLI